MYTNQNTLRRPRRSFLFSFLPRRITVDESQHVVLVRKGRALGLMEAGQAWIRPRTDRVWSEPATDQVVTVPGQEMLTADGASVRATVATTVAVTDPMKVVRTGQWQDRFYLATQLALRNVISGMTLDETLSARPSIDTALNLALAPVAEELGLTLRQVAVRDFIVPGELKRAVAEVVAARLSGQAALERARSESAALRSLANAAQAVANNPALLQLRLIQQMETSTGHTYVLGSTPL